MWHRLGPLVRLNTPLSCDSLRWTTSWSFAPIHASPPNDALFLSLGLSYPSTQNWFEVHSEDFRRMVWSIFSPEVNPVEHLYKPIRTQLCAPTNIRALWTAIETVTFNTPTEVFWSLMESLHQMQVPTRLNYFFQSLPFRLIRCLFGTVCLVFLFILF